MLRKEKISNLNFVYFCSFVVKIKTILDHVL